MNPRRIMEHIRKLGWAAIGIELVIVIVGVFIGMQGFGASAPAPKLYEHFGITSAKVAEAARKLAAR